MALGHQLLVSRGEASSCSENSGNRGLPSIPSPGWLIERAERHSVRVESAARVELEWVAASVNRSHGYGQLSALARARRLPPRSAGAPGSSGVAVVSSLAFGVCAGGSCRGAVQWCGVAAVHERRSHGQVDAGARVLVSVSGGGIFARCSRSASPGLRLCKSVVWWGV
jgi:hypothetical protein